MPRHRIVVVSPFIDKSHGTERSVAECLERLSTDYDIHLYSQRVENLDLGRIVWHRIPAFRGPHLIGYLWWLFANHFWRWRDRRIATQQPADIVFSPGINCLDADAIQVHVVFARLREQMKDRLLFRGNPWNTWHEILHRRMYYSLIASLERRVYPNPGVPLVAVSRKTAADLSYFYSRTNDVQVAYHGMDLARFSPSRRLILRGDARQFLHLNENDFAVLLIGNDWKSKGLPCLLNAVGNISDASIDSGVDANANRTIHILVVGQDNPAPFREGIDRNRLTGRVHFLPPRPDVEFYYAAADSYASPTVEDAFALPPAEAMACGLPAITSRLAGVAEIIRTEQNGFVLEDASDFRSLSAILIRLMNDTKLRQRIGENAVSTASRLNWDNTAAEIRACWEKAIRLKRDVGQLKQ
jgi:glycosyltransferase involved in cell wall biosynthesis